MSARRISGQADLQAGAAWLSARCPRLAEVARGRSEIPLRLRPDGFAALLQAIVGQQVSVASAAAIWARVQSAGLDDEDAMRAATPEDLRACGLSRPKARYAAALAEARVDYDALRAMPAAQVETLLTQIAGIGPWTAQIYAMFSLGHADVFAPADLALQEAARLLYGLPDRPRPAELAQMAQGWRPWRAVAARLLWAYYAEEKQREGVT